MDIPQRIDRPTVEGVTSSSISVSFLVPKPTTPEMKVRKPYAFACVLPGALGAQ